MTDTIASMIAVAGLMGLIYVYADVGHARSPAPQMTRVTSRSMPPLTTVDLVDAVGCH